MNNAKAKQMLSECSTMRAIRNWLIQHYQPFEIVQMEPKQWFAAIQFLAMARVNLDWSCGRRKWKLNRSNAKAVGVTLPTLQNAFPQDWYSFDDDEQTTIVTIPEFKIEG